MDADTQDLSWPIYEDYRMEHGELVAVGDVVRRYDPLANHQLVNECAKLRVWDYSRLVEFARTWGLFGDEGYPAGGPGEVEPSEPPGRRESSSWIWAHANAVRLALELSHYLQVGDHEGLGHFLDSYPWQSSSGKGPLMVIASKTVLDPSIAQIAWGEPAGMAEEMIAAIINANLKGFGELVRPGPLRLSPESPCPRVAVYRYLARIVTGGRALARCQDPTCGALYVVTHRRQRYCPRPDGLKGKTGSSCGARHRKRRQRQKEGG